MSIRVRAVRPVTDHNQIKALVELEVGGLRLRGIKLEMSADQWKLTAPGRRVQGHWQMLFDFVDPDIYRDLLSQVMAAAGHE